MITPLAPMCVLMCPRSFLGPCDVRLMTLIGLWLPSIVIMVGIGEAAKTSTSLDEPDASSQGAVTVDRNGRNPRGCALAGDIVQ
jgi:hypothetical protein